MRGFNSPSITKERDDKMPRCIVCGRMVHEDNAYSTHEGYICMTCRDAHGYIYCGSCGRHYIPSDNSSRIRCPDCEDRIYKQEINSYGTKPVPYYKNFNKKLDGKDIGVRYYGIEMEFNNSSPREVFELGGDLYEEKFIYNKSDSSISGGVEVVTSPMDKRVIPQLLKRMEGIFEYVGSHNYKDNAGLHIHVNKKTIDAIDRYKLNILLNTYTTQREKDIMYMLSGRKERYDASIYDHYFEIGTRKDIIKPATGHSVALNTSNTYTFEFRIFKSSNNPDRIMSYIELVDSMIDFCHTHGIKDINIGNFIVYLKTTSTNDILLNIIRYYESKGNVFNYKQRLVNFSEYNHKLDGLRWYEFYKVLSYLNEVDSLYEYCNAIDKFVDDYNNNKLKLNSKWMARRSQYDRVEKLKETIKKVLIHRIKSRKENKKCA